MKAAEKPAGETIDFCGKCNFKRELPHTSNKFGLICEECFLDIKQINLPLDEYDLQPGEMTKEQVADLAGGVSIRAVEKWISKGNLTASSERRRIEGVIRNTTILKADKVKAFLDKKNKVVQRPAVERETSEQSEQTGLQTSSPEYGFNFMQMLEAFTHQTAKQSRRRSLADYTGRLFLDVDELHEVSGVSITELKRAIDRGLKDGSLQHYSGKNRKSVYRAEQLDILLENLPPTKPPKPPKKKNEADQGEV